MKFLKWFCFILVCTDIIGYIVNGVEHVKNEEKTASKVGRFFGLMAGIAARVYVLSATATHWLLV